MYERSDACPSACPPVRPLLAGFAMLGAFLLLLPLRASAQVAWETPLLAHPHAPEGWAAFLAETDPGDNLAVFGLWRGRWSGNRVGIRVGLGEEADDDAALFAGIDIASTLYRVPEEPRLAFDWVAGIGFGAGDDVLVSIPFGVVAGWDIPLEDLGVRPYAGPRLVLDGWLGDQNPGRGDDLDLSLLVDLGADFVFSQGWAIRFGATLGDRDGIAIGVTFPR
ncbi:MAG: hypothetical protein RQ751_11940 [Longimicrobiales bacterium]|nr:hypothetical protein [Longimicrobiales bacterium]